MLIRPRELEAIRRGEVDLAFRRWDRPRVRVGTRMRTLVGLVEVTSVDVIDDDALTDDEARRSGADSVDELRRLLDGKGDRHDRPIHRIGLRWAGADPRIALRADDALDADELAALQARLERLDRASPRGPWTRATLEAIVAHPARRAPDLAESFGLETVVFKRNVRKLKELGLTESLPVGYRISPRGQALLDVTPADGSPGPSRPR